MTTQAPAIVIEAMAAATGRTRDEVDSFIGLIREKCGEGLGEISRQLGKITAADSSNEGKAHEIAQYAEASVLSDSSIGLKLRAMFGLAFVGGLALTLKVTLAYLVGIVLLALAGIILIGLIKQLLTVFAERFESATFN